MEYALLNCVGELRNTVVSLPRGIAWIAMNFSCVHDPVILGRQTVFTPPEIRSDSAVLTSLRSKLGQFPSPWRAP